ncbi:CorA family divalent cation transporter [Streptomyces sp. NPDC088847]|uniref:CorA family divalent cation transporter n=1 Tax=Streptomyces sp. NPDC088847 TaxID=3365909 RepID=UPI0038199C87
MTDSDPRPARPAPPPWAVVLGGAAGSPTLGDDLPELVRQAREQGGVAWIMVNGDDGDGLRRAADACGLTHGLAERASAQGTRPGLARVDDITVLTLRTCCLEGPAGAGGLPRVSRTGCVVLFAGPGFALAVEHGRTGLREALVRKFDDRFVGGGDSTELVRLVTSVVTDQYEEIAEALEEATEEADPEPDDDALARMGRRAERGERRRRLAAAHHLHRQIFRLRRTAGPAALAFGAASEVFAASKAGDDPLRDVAQRLRRVVEQTEQLGEMLDSARDAWTAEVGVSQNDDMRRISAVAALAAVPTVVVGNYGMNFDNMPELHWRWGYPMTIVATAVICGILYALFRRLKWL